jgi:hypothetical protein
MMPEIQRSAGTIEYGVPTFFPTKIPVKVPVRSGRGLRNAVRPGT